MMVLLVALLLLFAVLLFEFRLSRHYGDLGSALLSTFGGFLALLVTGTTFNVASRWHDMVIG